MTTTDDTEITGILADCRVIALVGASPEPTRDSNDVMGFLLRRGYRVIPVNPTCAGEVIHGQTVLATLKEIEEPVDVVDVFRRADSVGPIADEAIEIGAKALWLQLGIVNEEAASKARDAGLKVVMDRCTKIEVSRRGLSAPPA